MYVHTSYPVHQHWAQLGRPIWDVLKLKEKHLKARCLKECYKNYKRYIMYEYS